MHLVTLEFL